MEKKETISGTKTYEQKSLEQPLVYDPKSRHEFFKQRMSKYASLSQEEAQELISIIMEANQRGAKDGLDYFAYSYDKMIKEGDILPPTEKERMMQNLSIEYVNQILSIINPDNNKPPKEINPEEISFFYFTSLGMLKRDNQNLDSLDQNELNKKALENTESGSAAINTNVINLRSEKEGDAYYKDALKYLEKEYPHYSEEIKKAFLDYRRIHTLCHELFHVADYNLLVPQKEKQGPTRQTGFKTYKNNAGFGLNEATKDMMAANAARYVIMDMYPNLITENVTQEFASITNNTSGYNLYQENIKDINRTMAAKSKVPLSTITLEQYQESIYGNRAYTKRLFEVFGSSARSIINQLGKDQHSNMNEEIKNSVYIGGTLEQLAKEDISTAMAFILEIYPNNPKEARVVLNRLLIGKIEEFEKGTENIYMLEIMLEKARDINNKIRIRERELHPDKPADLVSTEKTLNRLQRVLNEKRLEKIKKKTAKKEIDPFSNSWSDNF
jgi:hypothetical protein